MRLSIITGMTSMTAMNETMLLRLMAWLSPVFPTGGFAYSAGLEQAVHDGWVCDTATLMDWLSCQCAHGSIRNEAVLIACAMQEPHDEGRAGELSDLVLGLAESGERLRETLNQGKSFAEAASHWPLGADDRQSTGSGRVLALPIAIGRAAGLARLERSAVTCAFLQAWAVNQLQAAIRLSVTGQEGAQQILACLEPVLIASGKAAANGSLDDLGGACFRASIASMNHAHLEARLFLS